MFDTTVLDFTKRSPVAAATSEESVEVCCLPLVEMSKHDTHVMTMTVEVDEEEEEKRDAYQLHPWISSISAVTSLSEFALTRISDHAMCSFDVKAPVTCPCDEECDLDSCGSSCSYIPPRDIDSNRTIITEDGVSAMRVSHEVMSERYFSIELQTDPIEMHTTCTQTHRRRRGVAQLGIFAPKKTPSVQSPRKSSSLLSAQKTSSLLSAQKTSSLLSWQRTASEQSTKDNAETISQNDNETF